VFAGESSAERISTGCGVPLRSPSSCPRVTRAARSIATVDLFTPGTPTSSDTALSGQRPSQAHATGSGRTPEALRLITFANCCLELVGAAPFLRTGVSSSLQTTSRHLRSTHANGLPLSICATTFTPGGTGDPSRKKGRRLMPRTSEAPRGGGGSRYNSSRSRRTRKCTPRPAKP
jgi:hypothetical protein